MKNSLYEFHNIEYKVQDNLRLSISPLACRKAMNNKYIYHSRISEAKFRSLLKCFSLDVEASKIAVLTGISRNTVNRNLTAIRKRISEFRELVSPFAQAKVEIDESCFGHIRCGVSEVGEREERLLFPGLLNGKGKCTRKFAKKNLRTKRTTSTA